MASIESAFRGASFIRLRTQVPTWLHALVEYPHYLHKARANDAEKKNVHGPSHSRLTVADTSMSDM